MASTAATDRIAELSAMPYGDYLQTPEWKERRKAAVALAGGRCQLCNADIELNAHHRTYERRGCELPGDLTVLCKPCHGKHHGHNATQDSDGPDWEWPDGQEEPCSEWARPHGAPKELTPAAVATLAYSAIGCLQRIRDAIEEIALKTDEPSSSPEREYEYRLKQLRRAYAMSHQIAVCNQGTPQAYVTEELRKVLARELLMRPSWIVESVPPFQGEPETWPIWECYGKSWVAAVGVWRKANESRAGE